MAFEYSRTQSQGDVTGKEFTYHVDSGHATLLAPGDVVRITGTADADGVPEVDAATAAQSITGILTAVDPIFDNEQLSTTGLAAGVGNTVKVNVDPYALYEVDVVNGPLTAAQVGLNADTDAAAATLAGGLAVSNMALNATGAATT